MQCDDGDSDKGAAAFGVSVPFEAAGDQARVTMHAQFKTAACSARVPSRVYAPVWNRYVCHRTDSNCAYPYKQLVPPTAPCVDDHHQDIP